jgi:hypothetical protein
MPMVWAAACRCACVVVVQRLHRLVACHVPHHLWVTAPVGEHRQQAVAQAVRRDVLGSPSPRGEDEHRHLHRSRNLAWSHGPPPGRVNTMSSSRFPAQTRHSISEIAGGIGMHQSSPAISRRTRQTSASRRSPAWPARLGCGLWLHGRRAGRVHRGMLRSPFGRPLDESPEAVPLQVVIRWPALAASLHELFEPHWRRRGSQASPAPARRSGAKGHDTESSSPC